MHIIMYNSSTYTYVCIMHTYMYSSYYCRLFLKTSVADLIGTHCISVLPMHHYQAGGILLYIHINVNITPCIAVHIHSSFGCFDSGTTSFMDGLALCLSTSSNYVIITAHVLAYIQTVGIIVQSIALYHTKCYVCHSLNNQTWVCYHKALGHHGLY